VFLVHLRSLKQFNGASRVHREYRNFGSHPSEIVFEFHGAGRPTQTFTDIRSKDRREAEAAKPSKLAFPSSAPAFHASHSAIFNGCFERMKTRGNIRPSSNGIDIFQDIVPTDTNRRSLEFREATPSPLSIGFASGSSLRSDFKLLRSTQQHLMIQYEEIHAAAQNSLQSRASAKHERHGGGKLKTKFTWFSASDSMSVLSQHIFFAFST
jgi:hypothetical protein